MTNDRIRATRPPQSLHNDDQGRVCAADADLVLRVYIMSETTATSRPFQKLLSSISFNVVFATPKPSNGQMHRNGSQGGSVASGDGGDSVGCGGDGSSGVASGAVHGMRREISISAADLDDADVPSSFHVRVRLLNFLFCFLFCFLFLFVFCLFFGRMSLLLLSILLRCCIIASSLYLQSSLHPPKIEQSRYNHMLLLLLLHPDTCLCRL